jgi:hypothetical protein
MGGTDEQRAARNDLARAYSTADRCWKYAEEEIDAFERLAGGVGKPSKDDLELMEIACATVYAEIITRMAQRSYDEDFPGG